MIDLNNNCRKNEDYLLSIGRSIYEFSKVVPGGLLVFFPSYKFLEKCVKFWGENAIWHEIVQQIAICVESRDKEIFTIEMKRYYKEVREKKKAIFLAVMRGKMSEGLDFSDIYGRAVMVVGFPLAPLNDPKVKEKQKYLDEERMDRPNLPTGDEWYISDAIRTANQAMGRVIRHKDDYGAMLFCDRRFKLNEHKRHISPWILARLNKQKSDNFDEIVQEISLFYANAEQMVLCEIYVFRVFYHID